MRCRYDKLEEYMNKEDGWAMFKDTKTYPDGISLMARYGHGNVVCRLDSGKSGEEVESKRKNQRERTMLWKRGGIEFEM